MRVQIKRLFRHYYNLQQIMDVYSRIIIGTVLLIAIIIVIIFSMTLKSQAIYSLREGSNKIATVVNEQQNSVNQFSQDITSDNKKIDNYQLFFTNSQEKYLEKSQKESGENDFYYLPLQMSSFFSIHSDAQKIILTNERSKKNIEVTANQLAGTKIDQDKTSLKGLYYSSPLVDKSYLKIIGTVSVTYSDKLFLHSFDNLAYSNDLEFLMLSDAGEIQYQHNLDKSLSSKMMRNTYSEKTSSSTAQELSKNYLVNKITFENGKSSFLLIAKKTLYRKIASIVALVLAITIIIIFFLRKSFLWVFKYYQDQLQRISKSMDEVGEGNFQTRLHVPRQDGELRTLTTGINEMLDAIDQYGLKIYQLELAQKDAKLHMLQAQINPHFLSNTLEYIRMYALTEGQVELAEVVYSFASLLRQSIGQENEVTFEQEVDLAEKYSYLFQMRYPNKIAYQYHIDENIKQLKVPKFIIQPLVENYFKHGLDLTRDNNFISAKILSENNMCKIIITDNGKGVATKDLQHINELLNKSTSELLNSNSSIGLVNVKARLSTYFEKEFSFKVESEQGCGTKITIQFSVG